MSESSSYGIALDAVDDDNITDFSRLWNDKETCGEFVEYSPKSQTEIQEFVGKASFFIITKRATDERIGWISYWQARSDYPTTYEIGYAIRPKERGKGYTTEAVRLVTERLFTSRGLGRIEALTDTDNLGSQRVLEKSGFKREGRLRKRSVTNGQLRDEFMYALLREEWEQALPVVS